jgi:SMODS-associated and fused to various effectors sensor domain
VARGHGQVFSYELKAMTRANVARRQGDDFQARLFWLKATSLLDPNSPIVKVAYEVGPKSFDDIVIEYDPSAAPLDHEGKPIYRRYIQCKWHTTAGIFGYQDLADPAFVNATRYSLLQRAHQAQSLYAPDGLGCRFELVTNWRLKLGDPLMDLVRKESDALDLDRLFDGTTDQSRMGRVRKRWREHLGIDHPTLSLVARVLALAETPESLMSLRERLDEKFAVVGMKRIPVTVSGFLYDDLVVKLLAQGCIAFDREGFWTMCQQEGILESSGQPKDVLIIGIRSFMHPIDNLEDRCERMLNLVPYFDGRYIRNETDWQHRILPELRNFMLKAARSTDHLRLILDAHVSLAFAVGTLLNVKSGKRIEIEQRTDGRRFWSRDDEASDPGWPKFLLSEEVLDEDQDEVALAVGLTHDIARSVRAFAIQTLHQVGQIVYCQPEGGVSQQSVRCGRHAWICIEAVVQRLQNLRGDGRRIQRVHVFIAGPNGFAFFLGQHQQAIGPVTVYEWDFDGQRGGDYSPGLSLGE